MVKSDLQKAFAAYDLWHKTFEETGVYRSIQSQDKFGMFLGDPRGPHREPEYRDRLINIYNPGVMRKINLILGPNGHALLKMWEAQMPETTTCSFSDYEMAFHRLQKVNRGDFNKLLNKLKQCAWEDATQEKVIIPTDMMQWIQILNGPHWETMLKAYEIKVREDDVCTDH